MTSARQLGLAAVLTAAGCAEDFALDPGRFACSRADDCANGAVCDLSLRRCRRLDEPRDSGPPADADAADADADADADAGVPPDPDPPPDPSVYVGDDFADKRGPWWWVTHVSLAELERELMIHDAWIVDFELMGPTGDKFSVVLEPAPVPRGLSGWDFRHGTIGMSPLAEGRASTLWYDFEYLYRSQTISELFLVFRPTTQPSGWNLNRFSLSALETYFRDSRTQPLDIDVYLRQGRRTYSTMTAASTRTSTVWLSVGLPKLRTVFDEWVPTDLEVDPIDEASTPTFTVLGVDQHPHQRWWQVGLDERGVTEMAMELGARLVSLAPYRLGGRWRYAAIFEDNLSGSVQFAARPLRASRARFAFATRGASDQRASFMAGRALADPGQLRFVIAAAAVDASRQGALSLDASIPLEPGCDGAPGSSVPVATALRDALELGSPEALRGLASAIGPLPPALARVGALGTTVTGRLGCPGAEVKTTPADVLAAIDHLIDPTSTASVAVRGIASGLSPLPELEAALRARLAQHAARSGRPGAAGLDRRLHVHLTALAPTECGYPPCGATRSLQGFLELDGCEGALGSFVLELVTGFDENRADLDLALGVLAEPLWALAISKCSGP